jgi:hypothetical protein
MERTFGAHAWNGLSLTEGTFVYRLRHQIMPHPQIMAVYQNDLGMPGCPAAQQIAKRRARLMTPFIRAYLSCPELVAWGHEFAGSSGYRFARAAPDLYARHTLRVLPASLSGDVNRGSPVLPKAIEQAVFPPQRIVLHALAGGYLVALVLAAVGGAFRRRKALVYTSLGVVVACVTATFADLLYAAGDYVRFGIQEAVFSRIAIALMAVAAIDALIGRLRGEATTTVVEPATLPEPPEPDEAVDKPASGGGS